jgi:hypothetical protein
MGLLVIICLALDVQAAPVMRLLEEGWWGPARYVAVGAILAQPALLGIWAVLGPQRAGIRWICALALVMLVWWADLLGTGGGWDSGRVRFLDADLDPNAPVELDVAEALFMLGVFIGLLLLVQLPLGVARWCWHWRVLRPHAPARHSPHQFSLRQVLGWTAFLAMLLGASRYLLLYRAWYPPPQPGWPLAREVAFYVGFVTRSLAPLLLPAIPLAGMVLGVRRRPMFLIAATICALCGAAASVAQIADQNASVRLRDGLLEELGLCGATIAVLLVVRACGFRLTAFAGKRPPSPMAPG